MLLHRISPLGHHNDLIVAVDETIVSLHAIESEAATSASPGLLVRCLGNAIGGSYLSVLRTLRPFSII